MNYPVPNFFGDFNVHAGLGFGAKTLYGYHEGVDINDNGGGNSDLGKELLAIASGKRTYWHSTKHPTYGFGRHSVLEITGPWGMRWAHYAHLDKDLLTNVQEVTAGQQIGTIGKSGTEWSHLHFSIFKVDPKTLRDGIDTIAKTKWELDAWWEDPIPFITKYLGGDIVANMYKMPSGKYVDISNVESNKVIADVYDQVMNLGKFVSKEEFEKLKVEAEQLRKRPESCPIMDPKAIKALQIMESIGEFTKS